MTIGINCRYGQPDAIVDYSQTTGHTSSYSQHTYNTKHHVFWGQKTGIQKGRIICGYALRSWSKGVLSTLKEGNEGLDEMERFANRVKVGADVPGENVTEMWDRTH